MAKASTTWKPGQSGNPGGRPKIAKAWDLAIGKGSAEAFAEALRSVYEVMLDGAHQDHNGNHNDPNWRFAVQKVLEYSGGKPKEQVEVTGSITPAAQALLEALRLTPHERRLAQDTTAAEDDAAMSALTDSCDGDELSDR